MKTITIRLPEPIAAEIEAESRERKLSKSDIVRERIESTDRTKRRGALDLISDLVGSIKGGPSDLSANKKRYLRKGYGRKSHR
jgi:hypothetical protein